jgi:hypothetical protein
MSQNALPLLTELANESGKHENLNPLAAGIGTFVLLLLLLFFTTRYNKDR